MNNGKLKSKTKSTTWDHCYPCYHLPNWRTHENSHIINEEHSITVHLKGTNTVGQTQKHDWQSKRTQKNNINGRYPRSHIPSAGKHEKSPHRERRQIIKNTMKSTCNREQTKINLQSNTTGNNYIKLLRSPLPFPSRREHKKTNIETTIFQYEYSTVNNRQQKFIQNTQLKLPENTEERDRINLITATPVTNSKM